VQKKPLALACVKILLTAVMLIVIIQHVQAREKTATLVFFPFDTVIETPATEVISRALPSLLPSRLSVSGRLAVVDMGSFEKQTSAPGGLQTDAERYAAAQRLGADYILTGRITKIGGPVSIDAVLVTLAEQKCTKPFYVQIAGPDDTIAQITSLCAQIKEAILNSPQEKPAVLPPEEVSPPPPHTDTASQQTGFSASSHALPAARHLAVAHPVEKRQGISNGRPITNKRLDVPQPLGPEKQSGASLFEAEAALSYIIKSPPLSMLCAGDVDGDGKKELLAGGPEALYIYRIGVSSLTPAENISIGKDEKLLHVDTGDFNENGVDEIYVTSYNGQAANSFVIECTNGGCGRIAENLTWFFRAYTPPRAKSVLLGQDASVGNPFGGSIRELQWRHGLLTAGEKLTMPLTCGIYSFAGADLDNQTQPAILVFRRGVFQSGFKLSATAPDGRSIWKDPYDLGRTCLSYTRTMTADNHEKKEPIPMRIISERSASGLPFMIVAKNITRGESFLNFLFKSTHGALCCMAWDGSAFSYNWVSDVVKDYIADYILEDGDGDGLQELYVLSVSGAALHEAAVNRIQIMRQR